MKSGKFHPTVRRQLEQGEPGPENGPDSPECKADAQYRQQVRDAVTKTMDAQKLDAWVYPTWSNPPRLIGDLNTPGGDNSQFFSPTTGFPSIQVPMGYTRGGRLPAGITFFGRAWSEPTLIKLAYAYEQATHHRRAPESDAAVSVEMQRRVYETRRRRNHGDHRNARSALHVRSRMKLRAMLRDVFGFKHVDAGGGWLIFALPPAELGVHPDEGPTWESGVRHQIAFMCDNIGKTIAELTRERRRRGRRVRKTRATASRRCCTCRATAR